MIRASDIALFLGALSLVACKGNGYEDEDWCLDPKYKVPLQVHVGLDDSFHDYLAIDSVFSRTRSGDESTPYLKYYVAAYPTNPSFPTEVTSSLSPDIEMKVHPGRYTMVGWVAYEEGEETKKSRAMNFYTDDFDELLLKNKYSYTGATPYKVAYRGADEKNIAHNTVRTSVEAKPAMALYRLEASDEPTFTPAKVVVKYSSLLPAAINGKTGAFNWWWDDISYTSQVCDSVIASDYVLSQPMETKVSVTVEVYDENNRLRARKRNLEIPLINGGITTVRGNFYSVLDSDEPAGSHGGGIVIDTEFDETVEIMI